MKRVYNILPNSRSNRPPFCSDHPLFKLLDSCKSMEDIKRTHAQLITSDLVSYPLVATKLIKLLSGHSLSSSHHIFEQVRQPDLFLYNTLIKAHASRKDSYNSLLLFRAMLHNSELVPNQYTIVFVLNACRHGQVVSEGEQVHVHAIKRGFEMNVFVINVLIQMYSSWGLLQDARKAFDWSSERDLFSWNLLISGYVGSFKMDQARELFDEMPKRDVVTWSTIIAGYVQVGCFEEALEIFQEMQLARTAPNEFTLSSSLAACANLVALSQGRWIHVYMKKSGIRMNEKLLAGLIDMYAKCGEIEFAAKIFYNRDYPKQTIWPWNAMIGGFAMHGQSKDALELFEQLKFANIAPNEVTFIPLLSACAHGRLVEEGRSYFKEMSSLYGIEPGIEHYGCLVDILSRAGHLEEAEEITRCMPMEPDIAVWGALLSGCRIYGDMDRGERIGNFIREFDPGHVGCNILFANMYSGSGRWNDARNLRDKIEVGHKKKTPGCTSIELEGIFHQFLVGDRSHPQTREIYSFLDDMAIKLKNAGYIPEVREVLLNIDDEDKETALTIHSERLAITFALINTAPGTPIRIVKNLRVCWDCHQVTKFISKVYGREIVVRDRIRFHHFKNGLCSCNDYW